MGKGSRSGALPEPDEAMPSRPDSDDRKLRRELEKAHGYGYNEVILLALLGISTICNVDKSLKRCEERHRKKEIEEMRARDTERWQEEEREVRRLQGTSGGQGRGGGSSSYRGSAPSTSSSTSRSKGSRGRDWRSDGDRRGSGATAASRDTRDSHRSYSRDAGVRPRYYEDGYEDQYDGRYGGRYDDRYYDRRRARSAA